MFAYPAYRVDKFTRMNKHCECCKAAIQPEPAFFDGSMYISYSFTVAILVTCFIVLYNFLGDPPVWVYMLTVIGLILLWAPFSFRYSRIIFLHVFGPYRYNPKFAKECRD